MDTDFGCPDCIHLPHWVLYTLYTSIYPHSISALRFWLGQKWVNPNSAQNDQSDRRDRRDLKGVGTFGVDGHRKCPLSVRPGTPIVGLGAASRAIGGCNLPRGTRWNQSCGNSTVTHSGCIIVQLDFNACEGVTGMFDHD